MSTTLITGGLGLIGSSLANSLHGKIRIINRTLKNQRRINNKDACIVRKDICSLTVKDFSSVDVIYHCASTVDNFSFLTLPYLDIDTNIKGTIHILETIRRMKRKPKIIYLSSFLVYGNMYSRLKQPLDEETPTSPRSVYAATKLTVEHILRVYERLYAIPVVIARLTNVYSELDSFDNPKKGALNYLVKQVFLNKPVTLYAKGAFRRDYIHVDDVVSALTILMKQRTGTYCIGSGTSIPLRTIIQYAIQQIKSHSKIVPIPYPELHNALAVRDVVVDNSKIRSLGWNPTIHYRAGINRLVKKLHFTYG